MTGNECSHMGLYTVHVQEQVFWFYTATFLEKELHVEIFNIPEFPAVIAKPLFIISLKLKKIKTYANSLKFK